MSRIRFSRNGFLTLISVVFYLEIRAKKYYFYKQGHSVLYSNVSNENFLINHDYFLFFEKLTFLNTSCSIVCPSMQLSGNQTLQLRFQTHNYIFQEDISLTVHMQVDNKNLNCQINITFIDKLDEIKYICPNESYFTIQDNGFKPFCMFKWCMFRSCNDARRKMYFTEIRLWDIGPDRFINDLYPYDNKYIYHVKVIRYIYVLGTGMLVGHLDRLATIYLIDGSKYICNNHTGRAILVNTLELFVLECNYILDIPFLDDKIKLYTLGNVYSQWYMKYEQKMDSQYYIEPKTETVLHVIKFSYYQTSYVLKETVLFFYVKFETGLCKQGRVYLVKTLDSFTCYEKYQYPEYFYVRIKQLSNQIPQSIQIQGLYLQVLKNWVPEILTKLTGTLFISDMGTNVNESETEIMNITMFIRKSVIRNLKIFPESLSINLPGKIEVSCQSGGVPVVSYFWTANNFTRSFDGGSFSIIVPQLNLTSITVFVALKYEYYWYNASRIYLIGRIPTIVIISSKVPKISNSVLCYTDGQNLLFHFKWICNDSNEPKDLIAVNYVTSESNSLIFHETAPLITFKCICLSTYRDMFGREIFAISADIVLNLQANEMMDCELTKFKMDETTWTIFVVYILIFFMIPSIFFLIAYFVTDVRMKSVIQSKVFNQLGFGKKLIESAETIPYFIIAKTDVGEKAFFHFLVKIVELDKTIKALRLFRQLSFRFSKRNSIESERKTINMNEARLTLFKLMERNEELFKIRSTQWTSMKSSIPERSSSSRSFAFAKRLDHVSIVKQIPSTPSKIDYLTKFVKNTETDSVKRRRHHKSLSLKISNSPVVSSDTLIQPRVAKASFKSAQNSRAVRHMKKFLKETRQFRTGSLDRFQI